MTSRNVILHLIFPTKEISRACLTDEEQTRAARFRFHKDAAHWSACRAGLRTILGRELGCPPQDVPLAVSEFGKPVLPHPFERLHFNLSHCADLAIVALCQAGPVGVDLEPADRAPELLDCETMFCHPEEIDALPLEKSARAVQLLRIWTAKEAVLKALGTGLSFPPNHVRIDYGSARAVSHSPLHGMDDQRIHEIDHPQLADFQAFVSAPASVKQWVLPPDV